MIGTQISPLFQLMQQGDMQKPQMLGALGLSQALGMPMGGILPMLAMKQKKMPMGLLPGLLTDFNPQELMQYQGLYQGAQNLPMGGFGLLGGLTK